MKVLKKILSVLLKILIVLALIGLVLYGIYFFTRKDSKRYIADDFLLYTRVNSLKDIYNNVIDLKAAEVLLSTEQLEGVYQGILNFKSNEISRSFWFKYLLMIKADIVIEKGYIPAIILDPGVKSLATRLFPLAKGFITSDKIQIEEIKKEKYTIYYYKINSRQRLYFSLNSNLVFISTEEEGIDKLYVNSAKENNISKNREILNLSKKVRKGGIAELYVNSDEMLESSISSSPKLDRVLEEFSFSDKSVMSFNVSNTQLFLSAYSNISTTNKELESFLDYKPASMGISKYLPDSTNLYSSINFKSFEDFYKIALYFQDGEYDKLIERIDKAVKLLFKMDINEFIFSWIGSEIGLFTMNTSSDPTVFVKVKDKKNMEMVLEKLDASILMETDQSLVLDNVRLNKIAIPEIIRGIIDRFVKGFDTPYYVMVDDFIFFSMNPEGLAELVNKYRANETLIRDNEYKEATRKSPHNANIFLYYDMASAIPAFLDNNSSFSKILRLYEKGIVSIFFQGDELKIDLSCYGVNVKKSRLFPGYPRAVPEGLATEVLCTDIKGSKIAELIYITEENNLIAADMNNKPLEGFPIKVESKSQVLVSRNRSGAAELITFSPTKGTLDRYDSSGEQIEPHPVSTSYKGSFSPVEYGGRLFFYSKAEKGGFFMTRSGEESRFEHQFKSPLLSPPVFHENRLYFYPKNFSGSVYASDLEGNLVEGWPREGGGISFCSPVLATLSGKLSVIFLTQAGQLNIWDSKGGDKEGFPLKVDGVYYSNPAVGNFDKDRAREIVLLDKSGKVSIVNQKGEVLLSKVIKDGAGKDSRILTFDFDRDRIDEIFIYGGGSFIIGLDAELEMLPGFPVKGSTKPCFTNINSDYLYEMVTGGFDDKIYVYTLNK